MSEITRAMPTVFLHEGLFVEDLRDPGGATNYGISLRFLKSAGDLDKDGWLDGDIDQDGDVDIADIKKMSQHAATKLYELHFWGRYGYGRIENQDVATKVFDLAINMGSTGAHRCIQRAVRAAIVGISLDDDGVLGPRSLKAINVSHPFKLLPALKSEAAGYYRSIRLKDANEKNFIKGWLNRAYSDPVIFPPRPAVLQWER